jgi:hypothetical protein
LYIGALMRIEKQQLHLKKVSRILNLLLLIH